MSIPQSPRATNRKYERALDRPRILSEKEPAQENNTNKQEPKIWAKNLTAIQFNNFHYFFNTEHL